MIKLKHEDQDPQWFYKSAWRGLVIGMMCAALGMALSCNEPPKRGPVFLTDEQRKLIRADSNTTVEIYDTLAYVKRLEAQLKAQRIDTVKGITYINGSDIIELRGCDYVLPKGHQILQNKETKRYCIGNYLNAIDMWQYFGNGDGFADTCELKEAFRKAREDYERYEAKQLLYQPIKK